MLANVPARLVEKLDKRLYDQLSDIATTDELRCMWFYNQMDVAKVEDGAIEAYCKRLYGDQPVRKLGNAVLDQRCEERIGRLLRQFAEVPWPKGARKDLAWLEKATKLRKRLARFWQAIREECKRAQEGAGMGEKLMAESQADIGFDMDNEHMAKLEKERSTCERESAVAAAAVAASRAKAAAQLGLEPLRSSSGGETAPVRRKQTKAKSARAAARDAADLEADIAKLTLSDPSEGDEPQPHVDLTPIPVKQDSLAVLYRMYPTHATSAQGTVRWAQFVQAMADSGFVATEANSSAVNITDGTGSISFHKPHPEPSIEPITLHSWAKRMRRRFDWSRERFVLREKVDGPQ
ncbi:hypothetical protein LTR85_010221 [Meristemomyces frigidus]|nr:hypothetical protein LTR85_010221 [Meristemomyces frigidus]